MYDGSLTASRQIRGPFSKVLNKGTKERVRRKLQLLSSDTRDRHYCTELVWQCLQTEEIGVMLMETLFTSVRLFD